MKSKKSKKSVTVQTTKTQDRAKYRCRPELERLIDLVNSIPPDRELPHIQDLMKECEGDKARVVDKLIEKLAGAPQSFTKADKYYELRIDFEPIDIGDYIASRYMEFRRLRMTVREMARLASYSMVDRARFQVEQFFSPVEERSLYAELDIDDRGEIIVRQDGWLEALIGVQADRLRECEICRRIFWAEDTRSRACPTRCNNALRQRKWRERQYQYEANRAEKERTASKKTGSIKRRK
jgi:hypothetical protein